MVYRLTVSEKEIPAWFKRRFYDARKRCNSVKDADYRNYGGRGIKFLINYKQDLPILWERFLQAGGCRKLEVDRIDNDGPYSLGNIQFSTKSEQGKNKRPITDKTREKLCVARRKRKLTLEAKAKISTKQKGMKNSNFKGLWHCGEFGVFESSYSAAKNIGLTQSAIVGWCGRRKDRQYLKKKGWFLEKKAEA